MVDFVISIAAKVAEYLVAPVGRQLGYLFHYNSNMAELRDQVENLEEARVRLQRSVDAAQRQGRGIQDDVQKWLTRANSISREAQEFIENEKKAKKSCFKGLCPNLISRHQLSRQAKKKAQDVEKCHGKGKFQTVSHWLPLPGAGSAPLKDYEAFESRASTLDKVMAALRDDKIKRIGVWGLGGVGKSTLVEQVAKLAKDDKLFDKAVMVAVSREQKLENIQAQIADSLGLNIKEESKSGRADRLIEILKKKKLLIILDDIWAKLDLEAVGIPCGDDHVGCKIVVTSRSIDVLSQDMGTQPNFEIRILSDDEAWQLFQNTAGDCIPEFNLQSVARKVAEKCGGLPVALVTVAKALKTKSLPCWEDALRQLTSPVKTDIRGLDENVYKSLELSYDSLESEDAKLLFLLCGLMGYGDISLDDLFKCSLGLGLFQGINTLDGSTNRLQALVDRLKSSSLLLDIGEENVKMHDVVRDVARQLASKDPRYMVIEATQSGIHESTRCVHLSLTHEGTLDLGEILDRPKIEFFRLVNEGPLKIPDPLFNGMGKLKVLHLFQMEFSSVPLSLQSLANLRTLCLHCCTLGGVAGIGELKKLEVLSFWGSKIVQLPSEIAQLTCLRWLDLSNCYELQVIPPNILSNLSQLEHLCMEPSRFTQSEDEERNACLAELKHLSRLTTLNIALQDLKLLPEDMVFEKLTRFKIFIGGLWDLDSPCETKRALKLYKAVGTLHLGDGIGKLLKKTEKLTLDELSGTKSVFHESYKEDFLQLKHLDVRSSPEIQYIVDSKYPRVQEHVLFPWLESLLLRDLINLEKVCHGPIPRGSFGNLKTLKVMECHGLKIFLSLTMGTEFLNLQKIKIEYCNIMQQIITYERESEIIEDGHGGTTLRLFPKLRSLKLCELPELMNFSSKVETTSSTSPTSNARSEGNCDNRMSFFSNQVSFPILEKLILHDLPKLREIWHHQLPLGSCNNLKILKVQNCLGLFNLIPSHLIQRFDNLKELEVNNCEVLKHVFDLQGLDGNIRILPRLESLRLQALPKLRRVVCEDDDKNDNVRCLFSSSTAFHNLKFLSVTNCGNKVEDEGHIITPLEDVVLFDGKASFPNLENLILYDLPKLREIWHHQLPLGSFNNLKILEVWNCLGLLNLIPSHLIQRLDNLKELTVNNCEVLKHVFDLQGLDGNIKILPRLESLWLKALPKLRRVVCNEDDDKNDNVRCLFSSSTAFHNLKFLSITNCGNKVEGEGHINIPMEDVMLFDGKVSFPILEKLILHDLPKLREIWHHQLPLWCFNNLKILKVQNCLGLFNLIPSHLIQRLDNLKELEVNNCEVLKHVFDLQGLDGNIRILPRLESLRLHALPKLRRVVCNEDDDKNDNVRCLFSSSTAFHNLKFLSITNCGNKVEGEGHINIPMEDVMLFDGKVSFPILEKLILHDLPKLREIWHHQLPLWCFNNLKILKVQNCLGLFNLIPSHLIQRLDNLKELEVNNCEVLKHVFDLQGLDGNIGILPRLESLLLKALPKLRRVVCNEDDDKNDNVRCLFSSSTAFHNLKFLSVTNCGNKVEDEGHIITPMEDVVLFDGKASFPNLENLILYDLPKLREIWHHQLPLGSCNNLKILKVQNCLGLFNLIPSHLIQRFDNLKKLEVDNCEVLKHVFDLQGLDGNIRILPRLESLRLKALPKLRRVVCNEDDDKNDSVRCLFSSSIPFHNLKFLSIEDCGNEVEDEEHINTPTEDVVLFDKKVSFAPNLEELVLKSLPKLTEIDGNLSKLKILKLEELHGCLLFKVSHSPNLEEIVLKSLLKLKEIDLGILPKLKILKVEKLPQLRHIICNEDKNFSKRCVLSSSMFKNFHNLKELHIIDCGMEDMRGVNTSTNDEVLFNEKASFLESRASTLNDIMDALRDDNINLIGVWGMAGVGKTTLLKQVAQQAKQHHLFTRQAYIDLSSIPDSENLRQRIAKALGFRLWREDESRRADELKQRLKEGKILIILDDISTEIDLEKVGIPCKGDETQCKIVLASRDDLLCKDMGAQICFPVKHLPPDEAWSFFKKTAGDSVEENLELQPIAIQVVEECEGLPIAIVTIAKALKNETVAVWENALEQLRSCAPTNIRAVDKKVYSCLEWSYTHLKGDDVKSLFLLCGMLGYGDISLDLLLRYGMGLDLFDRIDSLEQARNRLLALVEILKASGLLLDSHEDRHNFDEERASSLLFMNADNKFVRMHCVVREVARAIASKDSHPFVVKEDAGLEEWSETDESKSCTFISLNCKAMHELPRGLVCPDLQSFLLHSNNPSLNIPNTFFEGMKKLKVLDLSHMHFTTLPSSLDSLANLQTLCLDGCELGDIALIGKLTKLEVLSLVGSTIQELPNEMVQLTNLRLLNLNGCQQLEVIPRNILSSLSRLECLCMKSSFAQWAVEGERYACLSELNHLSHLTTLEIDIPNVELLPKDLLFQNLTRYAILIGNWEGFRTKRALKLDNFNRSLHLGDGISKLLERSEEIEFWELNGTKYVLYPSDRESFLELKHLQVSNSPEIQYIIDPKDQWFMQHGAFPSLESLVLESLNNLEEVWHGPIPIGSFGNLRTLNVDSCPKLKFLLMFSTARGLSQLEEMTIKYCDAMQQIIAYERESEIKEDGHVGTNLQLFPKLRSLKLESLPQLINFSSELQTTSSTSLSTNARSEGSFFSHKVSFPKLEELTLKTLPKLKDIWHHQLPFESFSNLQILRVYECPCLLNLVPAHLIHNFQILKEINVQDCELLEHVIILQEIDGNVEILSKLETLKLEYLPRLRWIEDGNDRMISSLMTLMNIQNLQELHITDCGMEDLRKM